MKKSIRKWMALALSAACALGLGSGITGFAQETETEQIQEHPAKDVTYLTVFTPQQSCYMNMEDIVKKYQEEVNPNFNVDFQYVPDRAAYLQKLKILVSSNEVPDMWNIDTDPYAISLLEKGYVQELTPTIEKYGLQDVFQEAPLAWGRTRDGAQIGIPNDFQIEVFWYNTELFEKAGVEPPENWDEFMDVCAKLKESGTVPIATSGLEAPVLLRLPLLYMYRYGGNDFLLDLARGKQKMNSEVGLKAAQFLADLGTKGYFQESFASYDYTTSRDYFLSGKAAMYFIGTGDFAKFVSDDLSEDVKGKIDYFKIPKVNEGETQVGNLDFISNSSTPIGFSAASFDEEMESFINFYAHNIGEVCEGRSFPCVKDGKAPSDDPLAEKLSEDMAQADGVINLPDLELDPTTNELFGSEAVSLCLGAITPEEFAEEIDASIEANAADYFGTNE